MKKHFCGKKLSIHQWRGVGRGSAPSENSTALDSWIRRFWNLDHHLADPSSISERYCWTEGRWIRAESGFMSYHGVKFGVNLAGGPVIWNLWFGCQTHANLNGQKNTQVSVQPVGLKSLSQEWMANQQLDVITSQHSDLSRLLCHVLPVAYCRSL